MEQTQTNEIKPRFFVENDLVFDRDAGGANLNALEIRELLNQANELATAVSAFQGKMKWAMKELPVMSSNRHYPKG